MREVEIMKMFAHPHVVRLYEVMVRSDLIEWHRVIFRRMTSSSYL
jgi:hypothetical protein